MALASRSQGRTRSRSWRRRPDSTRHHSPNSCTVCHCYPPIHHISSYLFARTEGASNDESSVLFVNPSRPCVSGEPVLSAWLFSRLFHLSDFSHQRKTRLSTIIPASTLGPAIPILFLSTGPDGFTFPIRLPPDLTSLGYCACPLDSRPTEPWSTGKKGIISGQRLCWEPKDGD
ncbi:hypothetical protein BJ508DRAFT_159838 [Ascobolus immersus RN42]|uniref:Uncharacterized protein n=1 Tax=Ascobolus immersus RN42 TaxID=1160509 RepID=A0A3N4HWE5_ASCIM|nr:hypothetical protein BJ508DRAFT_159838 [Ascobolus immersus RN42]